MQASCLVMQEERFPDLEIRSANIIDPKVHTTLWNKDTCRCKLVRVYVEPHVIPVSQFLSSEELEKTRVKPYKPKNKEEKIDV